jgi:hypothetical protein
VLYILNKSVRFNFERILIRPWRKPPGNMKEKKTGNRKAAQLQKKFG